MYLLNWVKKPYFFISSPKFNFLLCFGVGLFIFLFLFIFQPFGITSVLNNKLLYTSGFGFISFLISIIYFLVTPFIFKDFFKDENWTIGKNILFLFFIILSITFGNYFYNSLVQNTDNMILLSLKDFFIYTFSLAIFPIIIFTYVSEKLYRMQRVSTSRKIMETAVSKEVNTSNEKINKEIEIFGENKKEMISFDINDLIYVTSQGNYASFYLNINNNIEEKVLRNTLSNIYKEFNDNINIIRCHKSYIINSKFMTSISGNARGYFLKSEIIPSQIPVSRNFSKDKLRELIY